MGKDIQLSAPQSSSSAPLRYRILVVDDEPAVARAIARRLRSAAWEIETATSGPEALSALASGIFDVVLADLRMPGLDGEELVRRVRVRWPGVSCVVMSGEGTIQAAVRCVREGAMDFLTKPFVDWEAVNATVTRACAAARRDTAAHEMRCEPDHAPSPFGMVGESGVMREVLRTVRAVGPSEASVLICGESGTGKELIARALHDTSPRSKGPFVAVNCGALAAGLLEGELFGHRKGAFTGATDHRLGLLDEADGGTLFLDEIGDMPLALQTRLLRVLQEGEVKAVGAPTSHRVDIRVLAATHVDLEEAVRSGRFRSDLFFRLNVIRLDAPPLRARGDDVVQLARHFLQKHAIKHGRTALGVDEASAHALKSYAWPGNVRELENAMARATVLRDGNLLPPHSLPSQSSGLAGEVSSIADVLGSFKQDKDSAVSTWEMNYLTAMLGSTGGNVSEAARRSGLDRSNFKRLMRKHAIAA